MCLILSTGNHEPLLKGDFVVNHLNPTCDAATDAWQDEAADADALAHGHGTEHLNIAIERNIDRHLARRNLSADAWYVQRYTFRYNLDYTQRRANRLLAAAAAFRQTRESLPDDDCGAARRLALAAWNRVFADSAVSTACA